MTKDINIRELALEILLEVERGQMSHIVLRNVLDKYQYLEKRDRAFLTRLAEGTIERRLELDYLIDQVSHVKVKKMKPVIRNIIRSGLYQIKYMDSVPVSAACNESVKLTARRGFGNLKGFVNGVLRNLARESERIPYPSAREEYLSVKWSMPLWIVKMWIHDYGPERTEKILESFYREVPTMIRINENQITKEALIQKLEDEQVQVEAHGQLGQVLMISGYDYLGVLDSFLEGDFQVQDPASVMAAQEAGIKRGDYVIDVCAAPGGKALHAAQLLDGSGHVEARDLTEHKVELIRQNIERMGFANVEAVQMDATVRDEASKEKADVLLADLPCSGLGVLAKKSDLKYRVTPEEVRKVAALQREILTVVKDYVKPGGHLLYSTCTVSRGENQGNAHWFTEHFPEYQLEWERQLLPGEVGDGFYLARFVRSEVKEVAKGCADSGKVRE